MTVDGYYYNGKTVDCLGKVAEVVDGLPSLKRVVVVPYVHARMISPRSSTVVCSPISLHLGISVRNPVRGPSVRSSALHHVFVGDDRVPKCIVHGAGGTLLQHLKEHKLHSDVRPGTGFSTSRPAAG